jgi:hemerythrin superfamily protein
MEVINMARLFESLKEDHNAVKNILGQTIEHKDTSKFPQIRKMLEIHMEGEEKLLYPRLMEQNEERALESYEEHHVGKLVLNELNNMSKGDEAWIPKVKVLKDVLDHHIEEEENQIFPESKKLLSAKQQDKIFTRLKQAKSVMTKQPMSKILEVR